MIVRNILFKLTWLEFKLVASSARKQQDQRLTINTRAAHATGRGIDGPLKIQTELAAQGLVVVVLSGYALA